MMRGILEQARRDLSLLHESFSGKDAFTQPNQGALDLVRIYFDKGVSLYEQL